MVTVFDVNHNKLVKAASEKLKAFPDLKPPAFLAFAKTGAYKVRAPDDKDFWYKRCASLLRKAYIDSPIGVASLRTHYGGRKKRGVARERHAKAAGSIIRRAMQALEKIGFMEKKKDGRYLTSKGLAFMDAAAKEAKG